MQERVFIESAMPSVMSHLNRSLHLGASDSLNKFTTFVNFPCYIFLLVF